MLPLLPRCAVGEVSEIVSKGKSHRSSSVGGCLDTPGQVVAEMSPTPGLDAASEHDGAGLSFSVPAPIVLLTTDVVTVHAISAA